MVLEVAIPNVRAGTVLHHFYDPVPEVEHYTLAEA